MKPSLWEGLMMGLFCGTCADARGLKNLSLIDRSSISTMAELAQWTIESDKEIKF